MCQGSFEKTFCRVTMISLSYMYCQVDSELTSMIAPPLPHPTPTPPHPFALSGKLKMKGSQAPLLLTIPPSFCCCPLNACSV